MIRAWSRMLRRGHSPIGLDVGVRTVKAAQLRFGSDGPELAQAVAFSRRGDEDTANGALDDEECDRIASILRRRGFVGRSVVLTTPAGASQTSVLDLPPADSGAPVHVIARAEMARVMNSDPGSFEMAMWTLPDGGRRGKGTMALAAGCPTTKLTELVDRFESVSLDPIAIDLASMALARAGERAGVRGDRLSTIIDLGWSRCSVIVLHQGEIVYERRSGEAGLAAFVDTVRRKLGMGRELAERVIRSGEGEEDVLGDVQVPATVRGHVEEYCTHVSECVETALSYAEHKYPSVDEGVLQIVGGGAGVPGIGAALSEQIGCHVERLVPASFLIGDGHQQQGEPVFTLAVALSLWEEG